MIRLPFCLLGSGLKIEPRVLTVWWVGTPWEGSRASPVSVVLLRFSPWYAQSASPTWISQSAGSREITSPGITGFVRLGQGSWNLSPNPGWAPRICYWGLCTEKLDTKTFFFLNWEAVKQCLFIPALAQRISIQRLSTKRLIYSACFSATSKFLCTPYQVYYKLWADNYRCTCTHGNSLWCITTELCMCA